MRLVCIALVVVLTAHLVVLRAGWLVDACLILAIAFGVCGITERTKYAAQFRLVVNLSAFFMSSGLALIAHQLPNDLLAFYGITTVHKILYPIMVLWMAYQLCLSTYYFLDEQRYGDR